MERTMTQTRAAAPNLIARIADRFFQTRWLVRMPIGLYRAGFGFLFGKRLLMLEHIGRKSGARRRVVLEVLGRPAPGEYVIISGFAEKAQWYRNITANPRVRVSTGFRRDMAALAEPMPRAESAAVLNNLIEHHPADWKKMQGVFEHVCGRAVDTMPMVRLRVQPRH
jgi:deazaflavin-dependent oxidoreductase (nitroreductase family)